MKKNHKMRKIMLALFSAMLLVCVTIGATVAYLTDTKTVTNTFTVGNVQITLDEAQAVKDTNSDNWIENTDGTRISNTQSYKLLPGISYAKDPTVTVKRGSEKAYVRVLVTVTKKSALDTIFATHKYNIADIVTGTSTDWTYMNPTVVDDTRVYEIRYNSVVDASAADVVLPDVFQKIVMPGDITNQELASITGLEIKVVAEAIQAEGFSTADAAWAAFGA